MNVTLDDIERQFRGCEDETVRNIISVACEEVDDLNQQLEEFEKVVADSRWDNIEDVVEELEEFSDLINEHEFLNAKEFIEHYNAVAFELNFRRMFSL